MLNVVYRSNPNRLLHSSELNQALVRSPGTRRTDVERCSIFILSKLLHWKAETITNVTGVPRSTVQSILKAGIGMPRKPVGRRPLINDEVCKRLIARATLNAAHRRLPYEEIARLEGIQCGRKALVAAFRAESYHRRVATSKPLLNEGQKQARLAWAMEHLSWTPEMWARIVWTDECTFSTRGFGECM
jgi:hypothetical protein